ncbi:MAG TPA: hypothetical protein VMG37_19995 [Solirubrobacteraceae bacterium]|nr:hypothetical protein [Solirubrobacteraceae bacterium]
MKRLWRALAFLAAAVAALFLSTAALAVAGGSSPPPAQWTSTLGPASWSGKLTALYPGAAGDTELFTLTLTNAGQSTQRLSSITASIRSQANGDAETAAGADIPGCRATWFTVAVDDHGPLPARLASGASYTGTIELAMQNSRTDQDGCRGAPPAFTVTAG